MPDTFANEKTATPDNLAKTDNIDTITPALQTMFSSNATAAARMSRVQAGAEVMLCSAMGCHLCNVLEFGMLSPFGCGPLLLCATCCNVAVHLSLPQYIVYLL